MSSDTLAAEQATEAGTPGSELLLSVVVPAYNQAGSIVENVRTIRERVAAGLDEPFELVVVSDGSIDETEELLRGERSELLRVIHYDRNLGKGYAVKVGALAARGRFISYVDADLDLDPAAIPAFLERARAESLDFAIGSKRHPASVVEYPRSRRAASWLYQQAVRLLFRLNVRDTQVGLKLFRREVADEVMPLLLVKRYAFDLELLGVSRALGFDRIEELPVRLDYRFSGSGIGSVAVLRALVDTAAIFYRLRVLRYYARKRRLLAEGGYERARAFTPPVSVIGADASLRGRLDYAPVEIVDDPSRATSPVLAFLENGAAPAGNWLASAVPFLAHPGIAAVVTPSIAPAGGSIGDRAAAAIWESRLGGGSLYFRFTPGNLRFVHDFPARSIVVKRDDFVATADAQIPPERLCEQLDARGRRILYTPETVVVARRPPLVRPHFREVAAYARERAAGVRRRGPRAVRVTTVARLALVPLLAAAIALVVIGGPGRIAGIVVLAGYAASVAVAAAVATLRFRSVRVGLATAAFLPLTQLAYAGAFLRSLCGF